MRTISSFLPKAGFWSNICPGPHTLTVRLNSIVHTSGKIESEAKLSRWPFSPQRMEYERGTYNCTRHNGSSSAFVLFSDLVIYCQIKIIFSWSFYVSFWLSSNDFVLSRASWSVFCEPHIYDHIFQELYCEAASSLMPFSQLPTTFPPSVLAR